MTSVSSPSRSSAVGIPMPSLREIEAIASGFMDRSMPPSAFHHREHLIVTTYLLWTEPEVDWRVSLPPLIRQYNEAHGGANTDTAGYHHTITMVYLGAIEHVLAQGGHETLDDACSGVLSSPAASAELPLACYSRERLFSVGARRGWVAPDLAPLDYRTLLAI